MQHNNIAIGKLENNLYYLNAIIEASLTTDVAIKIRNSYTWKQWHRCLGHIGITGLQKLHGKNLVDGFSMIDSPQNFDCEACIKSKQTRLPLPKMVGHQELVPGKLTHTDVWGPA